MKTLLILFMTSLSLLASSLYEQSLKTSKGEDLKLESMKGKVVLVVNIATKCGYTPQLDGLEDLNKKYKDKGLVIIGIPSNDFGSQTPESSEGAAKFCRLKYGVSFPITEKVVVSGDERTPFFKMIQKEKGDDFDIKWNFEKFLFNKKGKLISHYRSGTTPKSDELIKAIEKEL